MESLFENKYICTKETLKEIYSAWILKSPKAIAFYIVAFLGLAVSAIDYIWFGTLNIFFPIAVLVLLLAFYGGYRKSVNSNFDRMTEASSGRPVENRALITETAAIFENSAGAHTELPLNRVAKLIETRNYFLILSDVKLMYSVKKDSFEKGTAEDFKAFIKSKI